MPTTELRIALAGLTTDTVEKIEALAAGLSPGQALLVARWLLARFDGAALASSRLEVPSSHAPATAREGLTILYGTNSGHSASIARLLSSKAKARGWAVEVANMADYSRGALKRETHLAVIVSTHGEGEPPESAAPFFQYLASTRAPKLEQCTYSVLALGDASYVRFCQAGVELDLRLSALGARRLLARTDADVDYQETAEDWIERVIEAFAPTMSAASVPVPPPAPHVTPRIGRENPWGAELLERVILSGRESTQCYAHLELSLEGSSLSYEPGDALGTLPENPPGLVRQLIEQLNAQPDTPVNLAEQFASLSDALSRRLEVTQVTASALRKYAKCGATDLTELLTNAEATQAYLHGRDWLDVLREHPIGITAKDFVSLLPELASRSYSIASSLLAHPDEVHLLVSRVSYETHGRRRSGVASGYLAEQLQPGERVSTWIEPNPHFRLPEDPNVPIILIGAGTGIAPFRAFIEARAATEATGKNWVVFGNRQFRTDFTYQTEWLKWREQGVLTRMNVAFSRDAGQKRYVTDELRAHGKELYAWLERGARIYLCGDRAKLSTSTDQALAELLVVHGGRTPEQAAQDVANLVSNHRYVKDVY